MLNLSASNLIAVELGLTLVFGVLRGQLYSYVPSQRPIELMWNSELSCSAISCVRR